jgi:hypothetical protein
MNLFYEKCCGSCGQAMHFTALFGHKIHIQMGKPRRQETRDSKSRVFSFQRIAKKQTGKKNPQGEPAG